MVKLFVHAILYTSIAILAACLYGGIFGTIYQLAARFTPGFF